MGVHGLWQLLSPAARTVSLAHLRDKKIAVDISVWLHQFVHGIMVQENDNDDVAEDEHHRLYLIALFHRICKLLFFGVKPIFVFDGQTPIIKKQTVAKRRKQRRNEDIRLQKAAKKLLKNKMKTFAVDNAIKEHKKRNKKKNDEDLPDEVIIDDNGTEESEPLPENILDADAEDDIMSDPRNYEFEEEDDEQEKSMMRTIMEEVVENGVNTEAFKTLEPEIQQQVIRELRSARRYQPPAALNQMQKQDPSAFSNAQLKQMIAKRTVTKQLQNIAAATQHAEAKEQLDLEDKKEDFDVIASGRIASSPDRQFVLIEKTPKKKRNIINDDTDTIVIKEEDDEEEGGFFTQDQQIEQSQPPSQQQQEQHNLDLENENEDDDEFETVSLVAPIDVNENIQDEDDFETVPTNSSPITKPIESDDGPSIEVDASFLNDDADPYEDELFPSTIFENKDDSYSTVNSTELQRHDISDDDFEGEDIQVQRTLLESFNKNQQKIDKGKERDTDDEFFVINENDEDEDVMITGENQVPSDVNVEEQKLLLESFNKRKNNVLMNDDFLEQDSDEELSSSAASSSTDPIVPTEKRKNKEKSTEEVVDDEDKVEEVKVSTRKPIPEAVSNEPEVVDDEEVEESDLTSQSSTNEDSQRRSPSPDSPQSPNTEQIVIEEPDQPFTPPKPVSSAKTPEKNKNTPKPSQETPNKNTSESSVITPSIRPILLK